MLKTTLINSSTGCSLADHRGIEGECTLITESLKTLCAHWRTVSNTGIETTNVITPLPSESILLTDLIITSSKKVAASTIVVRFSDGINTKILMEFEAATAPIEFSHAFVGGLTGWEDASLQIITNQSAMNVTTLIGYVKISETLTKTYSEWDAER